MEFDATFLIAAISFIVFVFIMNKIFYAPILNIMKARQDFVEENFEQAGKTKEQTKLRSEYREGELEKSREAARGKIAAHSQELKTERSKQISEYKNELYSNISSERDNLKNSAIEAKEILKDSVVNIAKEISQKILGESVNQELINKSNIEE